MITTRAVTARLPAQHRRVAPSTTANDDFADPLAAIVGAGFVYSEAIDAQGGVPRFSPYVEDQNPGGGSEAQLGTVVAVTVAVWVPGPPR
jgi:hypothetical protein